MVMPACPGKEGGAGSSSPVSFIGTSAAPAYICLSACQPAAMAAIPLFCSNDRLSQTALELEEAMAGLVLRGGRKRRMMDAAMAGPAVYISGGWQGNRRRDEWWAADERAGRRSATTVCMINIGRQTDGLSFEHGAAVCTGKRRGQRSLGCAPLQCRL
jgi:hypothetical protein